MEPADLIELRKRLKLSQAEMADRIGLTRRPYQALENGEAEIRTIHERAVEAVALAAAVEAGDPMMAPVAVRQKAVALARLLIGEP